MRFALIAFLTVMLTATAAAEPVSPCTAGEPCHLRMRDPSTLHTYKGDVFKLPPGRFLDEPTFDMLDDEFKRLQDQETRLTAENESYKKSMAGWKPGWLTLTIATLSGVASGISAYYYWTHR